MKITISFTTEEKIAITNMMLSTSNLKEVVDKEEHYVGNFGEMKYDNHKNEIVFDLKTSFIKATAGLMASLVNIIKAFISSCEMYSSSWLSDIKDLTKKEDEEKASE